MESLIMGEADGDMIPPWIFNSQTLNEIINDPGSIFIGASSDRLDVSNLSDVKVELPTPETEKTTVNQEVEDIVPAMPEIINSQPSIISNESYSGSYNFDVFVDPHTTKTPWVFSVLLNKVFVLIQSCIPIDFKWDDDPTKHFFVRAMPLYSQPQDSHRPVMRCLNHLHEQDKTNKGLPPHVWKHIIRVNGIKKENVMYVGGEGQHLSVIVPLGQPQEGVDTVRHMYEFVCQNSCVSGMNRRPIEIVFTLEDETGQVYGRKSVNVRICSCPKRDKEKEEKEYMSKNENSGPPPTSKKRKIDLSKKKPLSFSEAPYDTREYEVTIKMAGNHNVKELLKSARKILSWEYVRHGNDETFKRLIKEVNHTLKNLPE